MTTRLVRALALVAIAALPAGCARSNDVRRNVVLISIDTLRWDRLGCTGLGTARTSAIDGLAKRGVLYDNAVAATPLTLPSHSTLLSGRLPIEHGVRDNRPFRFPSGLDTVATTLRTRGYRTLAAIGGAPLARGCGLEVDFDRYDDDVHVREAGTVAMDERPADRVTDAALALLDDAGDGPFFLFVHYFDPHAPYTPPPPFAELFQSSPYDGEIAFTDQEVGRLVDGLRARGRLDDTILVLTADHGESLGDHGEESHGYFVYDATIRVPLVVVDPDEAKPGRVDSRQVRHQDVRPFLEARARGAEFDLAGPATRGEPALIESLYGAIHSNYAQLRGLRSPTGQKYLEACDEEFYDLTTDPGELDDRVAVELDRAAAARDALATAMKSLRGRSSAGTGIAEVGYLETPLAPELVATRSIGDNCAGPSPRSKAASIAALSAAIRLLGAGLADAARAELAAAVEDDHENPALWFWYGRALMRSATMNGTAPDMERAVDAFLRVREMRPTQAGARDLAIFCLAQIGRYAESEQIAAAAIDDGTAGAKTLEALARLYLLERGPFANDANPVFDVARGLDLLERAAAAPDAKPNPRLVELIEQCYRRLGRPLQPVHRGG